MCVNICKHIEKVWNMYLNGSMVSLLMPKQREFPERGEQAGPVFVLLWGLLAMSVQKMDLLEVLLELAVVHERVLPFRDELALELLRELHHLLKTQSETRRPGKLEGRWAASVSSEAEEHAIYGHGRELLSDGRES